jgi:hypothetical protein
MDPEKGVTIWLIHLFSVVVYPLALFLGMKGSALVLDPTPRSTLKTNEYSL